MKPNQHRAAMQRLVRKVAVTAFTLSLAGGVTACDSLLDVSLPGRIAEDRLADPAFANLMTRSVQNAYECALTEYAGASGLFGTELWTASNNSSRDHFNNRIDSTVNSLGQGIGCTATSRQVFAASGAVYISLAMGRDITRRFEAWTDAQLPNRASHLAYSTNYAAYSMTLLGEGYCRAVLEPNGPALNPPQVFETAEAWFTKALEYADAANDATARNLALLGRARVRLNRKNLDGAVADAQRIPAGFNHMAGRGGAERQNRIFAETWRTRDATVGPSFYNLTVGGVPDTRVRVQNMNFRGVDGVTPAWFPLKHNSESSPVRMASWAEAQLIIAEARLGQTAVDRINAVRASHGLPAFVPANVADSEAMLDQVLEERRREFFLEGRWLNDMIRHKGRAVTAFDEGLTHQNVTNYRPLYCMLLPQREIDSNPNIES